MDLIRDNFAFLRWVQTGDDGLDDIDDGPDQPELTEDEAEQLRCEADDAELDKEAHRPP